MLKGRSQDVQADAHSWYHTVKAAAWSSLNDVRATFPDVDLVKGLLVFNIRQNRYRLIVDPVFSRRKLYVKALLTHKEQDRGEWRTRWP